jgi:hypothetical protein
MLNDEKKRLSRETFRQEFLRSYLRWGIFFGSVTAILLIVCIPLTIGVFQQTNVLGVIVVLIADVISLACLLYEGIPQFGKWHALLRGKYDIFEDGLVDIGVEEQVYVPFIERLFTVHRGRYRYENALYFSRHGRHRVDLRTCNHATVGDNYYLIVLRGNKPKIAAAYNTKFYQLEE